MRVCGIVLAIMLGAAFEVAAAPTNAAPQPPPSPNPSVTHKAEENLPPPKPELLKPVTSEKGLHWFTASAATKNNQIERLGNVSSRPWTEIVGWHPGTSQFQDAENHESQFVLLSLKF
jgi:hypothetical protein